MKRRPKRAPRRHAGKAAGAAPPPAAGDRRRRWLLLAVILLTAGVLLYLVRRPVLAAMGSVLIATDRLEKADAAVVLGGDNSYEGFRPKTAVRLYRQGWVRKIVLSGPKLGYGMYESELMLPLVIAQGVPRSDIVVINHTARSTLQEAQQIVPVMERQGIRSFYVVTTNFHTRRARRLFIRASGGRMRVMAYPAPDDFFEPERWWETRDGRRFFVLEYLKSINSFIE